MWLEIGLTTGGVTAFFLMLMNFDIDYAADNKCLDWVECHCCCFEQGVPNEDDLSSKSSNSQEKTLNDTKESKTLNDDQLLDEEKEKDMQANLPSDVPAAIVCENNIQTSPTMITLSSQAVVGAIGSEKPLLVNGTEPVEEQASEAKSVASSKSSRMTMDNKQPKKQDALAVDSNASSKSSIKGDQDQPLKQDSLVRSLAGSKSIRSEQQHSNKQENMRTDSEEVEARLSEIQGQSMASKTGSSIVEEQTIVQGSEKVIPDTEICNSTVTSKQKRDDSSDSKESHHSIATASASRSRTQSITKEEASCTPTVEQIRAASIEDAEIRIRSPPTWATFDSSKLVFPPGYKGPRHGRTSHNSALTDDSSVEASCKDEISTDTRSASIFVRDKAGFAGSRNE
jgi:hypothetical protein